MKITAEMMGQIQEVAEELFYDYEVIGVRVQEQPFELGEMSHTSHIWVDGEDTGEELNGVCAVLYDRLNGAHHYFGDHVAIVAGNSFSYGEDPGEVIIEDAVVVEILA